MTKLQRRKLQLENHYASLRALAAACGIDNVDGKKLSTKLFNIEQKARKSAIDYCNGVIDIDAWLSDEIFFDTEVQKLFDGKLKGLIINGDARGYTLKINDELMKPGAIYSDLGLHTDWGGYGILSPDITGKE
jgi:hypothetical protein